MPSEKWGSWMSYNSKVIVARSIFLAQLLGLDLSLGLSCNPPPHAWHSHPRSLGAWRYRTLRYLKMLILCLSNEDLFGSNISPPHSIASRPSLSNEIHGKD